MADLRIKLDRDTVMKIVLGVCLLAIVVIVGFRALRPANPYTFDRLTQELTLVCRETGEEFTMPRGRVEQMLWDRPGPLDPSVGIENPKTGRPTLFPKSEWEQTIERINADRRTVAEQRSRGRD